MFMLLNKVPCFSSSNNKHKVPHSSFSNNKQFNVSTCKELLKKLIIDAKSLYETKSSCRKAMRQEIVKLLMNQQLNEAHILAEYLFDHERLCLLLLLIEYHSEHLAAYGHLLHIEDQNFIPTYLLEAVSSLCYAALWYAELPDLDKLLSQLYLKYGKQYIDNVSRCKTDHAVDEEVVKLLSVPKPTLEERNKLLKEIANEFAVLWDPVSVSDTTSSASQDSMSMSRIETDTMLRFFNKIPCSNNKQFNFSTCKTLLEKVIADAQSLVDETEKKMDALPNDIFKALVNRETPYAYTLAGYLLNNKNLCVILRHVLYFCQQVAHHLPYIESRRKILPEVKESIAGLCYLGSRCSEIPELEIWCSELVSQFSLKYGEDYVSKVNMLMEDGVKEEIMCLFVPKPLVEERNELMKEIANKFGLKERLIEKQKKHINKIETRFRLDFDPISPAEEDDGDEVSVIEDTSSFPVDKDMLSSSDFR